MSEVSSPRGEDRWRRLLPMATTGQFGGGGGAVCRRSWRHDEVAARPPVGEFVHRYERLIASCVLKVLRRYGAIFSREDLDDLVGDVWLTLLRDDMKKLRQYDA